MNDRVLGLRLQITSSSMSKVSRVSYRRSAMMVMS